MGYRNHLQIKYISRCIMAKVRAQTLGLPVPLEKVETHYCKFQASLDETKIFTRTFCYQTLESSRQSWDGIGQALDLNQQRVFVAVCAVSSTSRCRYFLLMKPLM